MTGSLITAKIHVLETVEIMVRLSAGAPVSDDERWWDVLAVGTGDLLDQISMSPEADERIALAMAADCLRDAVEHL